MSLLKNFGKLPVPIANGSFEMVEIDSIEYLISDNQTTKIYLENKKEILGFKNIGFFEDALNGLLFRRVHNTCIVNLSKIDKCSKEGILTLKSGKKIEMSRRKADAVFDLIYKNRNDDQTVRGVAFLVIDHNKKISQTEPVQLGKQLVGRKNDSDPCDIMIDNGDKTVSRKHFFIEATRGPEGETVFSAYLHDPEKIAFVDQQLMKAGTRYPLRNNSLLKAGKTSILFKTSLFDSE